VESDASRAAEFANVQLPVVAISLTLAEWRGSKVSFLDLLPIALASCSLLLHVLAARGQPVCGISPSKQPRLESSIHLSIPNPVALEIR
jgi:hypothetical protein